MTGSMFCFCPLCGTDLRGEPFSPDSPDLCKDGCGALDHYSRLTYSMIRGRRRTILRFRCPDCGKRWER